MKSIFDIARYSTSRAMPLPTLGKIDYITAGNGLYKRAVSDAFLAMIPIVHWPTGTIPSLPDLEPIIQPRYRRIPPALLLRAIYCARLACSAEPAEAMYHVRHRDNTFYLSSPIQERDAGHVGYKIGGDDPIILDIHSHHNMRACFSPTDDRDELGLQFYGVLGEISSKTPAMAIRIGVYGAFWPVAVSDVFDYPAWYPGIIEEVSWT